MSKQSKPELENMKFEVAREMGVNLTRGYNGNLSSVENGRVGGQMVRKMVEDGRDCSEVLIQIAAVRSAINNVGKVILQDHIQHCIVDAVERDDEQALDSLCQAIDKFIK